MPKSRSHLTHKKQHKQSDYRGVYYRNNEWITQVTLNGKRIIMGPYNSERDAAKAYDTYVLDKFKEKAVLNFGENKYKVCKIKKIKIEKKENEINKRIKYSTVTKNKVCANQKWSCNFCKKILSDIFIVDHIIPLFLGGSNEEFNLQALCPSCERFKTSYMDHKVISDLKKNGRLTVENVLQAQENNYHKMMCQDPNSNKIENIINAHDNSIVNYQCATKNDDKSLELNINGIKIRISI